MGRIFTVNFWIGLFFSTFFTMLMIYLIKKANQKVKLPIVSDIVEGV